MKIALKKEELDGVKIAEKLGIEYLEPEEDLGAPEEKEEITLEIMQDE